MRGFIKLTSFMDRPVFVAVDKITYVEPAFPDNICHTSVVGMLGQTVCINVKESVSQVMELIASTEVK